MVRARVGMESDRPLPTVPDHAQWRPGGTSCRFRASIVRNNYKWAVMVLSVSADRERAFIRFETETAASVVGKTTAWVSVDELQEG